MMIMQEVKLMKQQNNRPGNQWHIKMPLDAPAVCPVANQLQAAQVSDVDWASAQRVLEVLWDAGQPSFFTVKGQQDARIHARDVCGLCSAGLLKRFYAEQGK
jgi:hypothetical protein